MVTRIITAIVLAGVLLPVVFLGGILFEISMLLLVAISFIEIMQMASIRLQSPETVLGLIATLSIAAPDTYYNQVEISPILLLCTCAFFMLSITVFSKNKFSFEKVGVICLAALYVGLGGHYVIALRNFDMWTALYVFAIGWITDTGAYFVGRAIGKKKLAPHISPNKSVEGAIGGVVLALLYACCVSLFYKPFNMDSIALLFLTFVVSIAGQMGDLVESALKRFYNVKDSGNILPGHGGVLDRFDSTLFAVVACQLMLIIIL